MSLVRTLCISFLLASAASLALSAQVDRATLTGTVTDSSGAIVPDAVQGDTGAVAAFRSGAGTNLQRMTT